MILVNHIITAKRAGETKSPRGSISGIAEMETAEINTSSDNEIDGGTVLKDVKEKDVFDSNDKYLTFTFTVFAQARIPQLE